MLDIDRFKEIIDSFYNRLLETKEDVTNKRLTADKWALAEIVGHLIDSASNNHQRFVRLQFGDLLDFPAYDGEEWIKAQRHIDLKWSTLVTLWYSYNCLLLNVIENADETAYENVWVKDEDAIPLGKLISEYYKHIEWHIEHFNGRLAELL